MLLWLTADGWLLLVEEITVVLHGVVPAKLLTEKVAVGIRGIPLDEDKIPACPV